MSPKQKALLTVAFEALGPERVTRGLQATGHQWRDCFLALAISGEPDALVRELKTGWRKEYVVGTHIGVSVQAVTAVVTAWDHHEGAFRTLAAEWLELNRATVSTHSRSGRLREGLGVTEWLGESADHRAECSAVV